ncbi:MAG: hypothetical protein KJ944_08575 [Alphaproteobacteria bacterium]|nr:hypothetical protein [Alphaproteobacteria bacterium]MBU1561530.1 hypothetical protein [Alphaproteobacteria bacterium]MBU2302637.1 hypothetical protein [Alphaproteobacteria bacterium]MBU2367711.1 hypothetical protein [Alphaproteobacteria bacterium]
MAIPYCLPDYLAVPLEAAAYFHAIGDAGLSGRDIAYAVSALWLAANTDCLQETGDGTMYRIPDNGLRHAMGLTRRESIDTDDDRHKRLARTTFKTPTKGDVRAPVSPLRHNLDDKRTWFIPRDLVDAWTVRDGEPVVYLPLMLLQQAKSRFSVEAYLHAMAAANGLVTNGCKIIKQQDDRCTIQADDGGFHRFMATGRKHDLHRVRTGIVAEIDKDLPAWADTAIEVFVRTSASERFPRGRFMSARIHVIHPPLAELEARAAGSATWVAPIRTSVPGWEAKPPRPRSSRAPARRPLPAPISDVVYIPEPEIYVPAPSTEKLNSDEDVAF